MGDIWIKDRLCNGEKISHAIKILDKSYEMSRYPDIFAYNIASWLLETPEKRRCLYSFLFEEARQAAERLKDKPRKYYFATRETIRKVFCETLMKMDKKLQLGMYTVHVEGAKGYANYYPEDYDPQDVELTLLLTEMRDGTTTNTERLTGQYQSSR